MLPCKLYFVLISTNILPLGVKIKMFHNQLGAVRERALCCAGVTRRQLQLLRDSGVHLQKKKIGCAAHKNQNKKNKKNC